MAKIFDNPLNLNKFTLMYRALDADPNLKIRVYDKLPIPPAVNVAHYVEVIQTTLTDAQILNALAIPQTQAEANAYALYVGSRASMKAIPSWATWTEAEALDWGTTNIGTPLANGRNTLPATLTLVTTRAAIVVLLNILDSMWILQTAIIRMMIALRNKVF